MPLFSGRINLSYFADSALADELAEGVARLRFGHELEPLYVQAHLQRVRLRVRAWFTVAALTALFHMVVQAAGMVPRIAGHPPIPAVSLAYAIADGCSFALLALAWTPLYRRLYLPVARLLVPVYALATTTLATKAMADGHAYQIAMLTMLVIVLFFFAGLLFRTAVFTTVLVCAAFWALGLFQLPTGVLVPSGIMLMVTAAIAVIGYRDIEHSYRRGYLENALLQEMVARDELSGLMNRRAFDEHIQRLWQHAQRDRRAIAVLMIDIDHFKSYNDSRGHQAGDTALRAVAQLLKRFARRPLDLAARYGGDEFVAVLYDLPAANVHDVAEAIRQAVQQTALRSEDAQAAGAITVSIGVGLVTPVAGRSVQGAIQLADEALYQAKQAGRNRVSVIGPEGHQRLHTGSFRALELQ